MQRVDRPPDDRTVVPPARHLLRAYFRIDLGIAVSVAIILLVVMASYKINNWYWQRGDAAVLYQVTNSIAYTGEPKSSAFASTTAFVFDSTLKTLPADKFSSASLAPPLNTNDDPLGGHAYYILYPIAIIARLIPSNILLLSLTVFCFIGMLPVAYFELRTRGVPIIAAALFCVLVMLHPSWTEGLLYGQVYPDRFFILAGLVLMFLASRARPNKAAIIAAAVLCALVNERGALIAGLFMVVYTLAYWKGSGDGRLFKLCIGAALLLYSVFLFKLVLVNPYYANNAISLGRILALFRIPSFDQTTAMMFLASAPLLILALFEWRAAAIAIFLMLPNVFTTIGGAEKIGWSTHYSSFYFPAVVWAAVLGTAVLYRRVGNIRWLSVVGTVLIAALALSSATLDPNSWRSPSWSFANLNTSFLGRLHNYVPPFVGGAGAEKFRDGEAVAKTLPDKPITVTTVEQGMPLIYGKRLATLLFFPLGLDHAQYAIMATYQQPGKPRVFYGAVTFLGASQQVALNDAVMIRMRKDGYDFAHAAIFPQLQIAVIKRTRT